MNKSSRDKLHIWEVAFLVAFATLLLLGATSGRVQADLAGQVVRLHVLANSDTAQDQALKLEVRDGVLDVAAQLIGTETDVTRARAILEAHLDELTQAAAAVVVREGYTYSVTVSLEEDVWFPTKEYADFALPAGSYTALRVAIGEGGGENWWCVVFPPLCFGAVTESVEETALDGGLSTAQVSLMTGETEGYVVKFKALELWDSFVQAVT